MHFRAFLLLTVSAGLLACTEDPTQLLVVVDSDMSVPQDLVQVQATVRSENGRLLASSDFALVANRSEESRTRFSLPLSFGVLAPTETRTERVMVDVSALGTSTTGQPSVLFTRQALTGFVEGKSLLLPMYLASQCQTLQCDAGQTCTEKGCVSERVDETRLREATGADDDLSIGPSRPVESADAGVQADANSVSNGDAGFGQDVGTPDGGATGPGAHLWSLRAGGAASDEGLAMTIDSNGHVYVAGFFGGTVDFGGGALDSAGAEDIFVASYTADGRHRWSKRFGGPEEDKATDIFIGPGTNLMVTGWFNGTANLGSTVMSQGESDIFLMSLDPSTGDVVWSDALGGTGFDYGQAVVSSANGITHLAGRFSDSMNVGGGVGTLTSEGWSDLFVITYNAGGPERGFSAGSDMFAATDSADALALDASGNLFVGGRFTGTVNLGGQPLTSAGGTDIFLASYGPSGNHRWSKGFGGFNTDSLDAIAVNSRGEVFMFGVFRDTVNFGGSDLTSVPPYDTVVASYTTNGLHRWSTRLGGGTDTFYASDMTVSGDDIYLTGAFEGVINVNVIGGRIGSRGEWDIFVTRFSRLGVEDWTRTFGGTGLDYASSVRIFGNNLFLTGDYWGPLDFGGGALMNAGNADVFVMSMELEGR